MDTPLHNHAAERALLSLLESVSTTSVPDALAMLDGCPVSGTDFAHPLHAALYEAAVALLRGGEPVSALALVTALRGREGASPAVVAKALTSSALVAGQWPTHAREVRQLARRRALLALGREVQAAALNPAEAPESAALKHSAALASLAASGGQGIRTLQEDVGRLLERLDDVANGRRVTCLPTGIEVWDELLGGLQGGVLTFIGAQPGVGKSALVGTMVRNLARAGHPVGLFSLEDSAEWVPERTVSRESMVPVKVLNTQRLDAARMRDVGEAATEVYGWAANVRVEDGSGVTARQAAAAARQMVVQYGCRAIFLDHLGELDVEASQHDRYDLAVGAAVRALRDVAKDFGIPVVVCAHFHRPKSSTDAEPRYMRPSSASWANSAGVERMARVAVGLWLSKEPHLQDYVIATILKQTRGDKDIDFAMRLHRPSSLVESQGGKRPEGLKGHHEDEPPARTATPEDVDAWRSRFGGGA